MKPYIAVVIPLYNEAGVVQTLIERVDRTLASCAVPYQIAAVDDGSSDATPAILGRLERQLRGRLIVLRPPRNLGQFGATRWGLARVDAEWLAVMDGDLQDPPELLAALVPRLRGAAASLDCVFAVKASRKDPAWFRVARAIYAVTQRALGSSPPPRGAGSYCAMRPAIASRVSEVAVSHANLAPVLSSLANSWETLPYHKEARYDGRSRVGPLGLAREALGSLAMSGALYRLAAGMAAAAAGVAIFPPLVSTSDAEYRFGHDEATTANQPPATNTPSGESVSPASPGPRSRGGGHSVGLSAAATAQF